MVDFFMEFIPLFVCASGIGAQSIFSCTPDISRSVLGSYQEVVNDYGPRNSPLSKLFIEITAHLSDQIDGAHMRSSCTQPLRWISTFLRLTERSGKKSMQGDFFHALLGSINVDSKSPSLRAKLYHSRSLTLYRGRKAFQIGIGDLAFFWEILFSLPTDERNFILMAIDGYARGRTEYLMSKHLSIKTDDDGSYPPTYAMRAVIIYYLKAGGVPEFDQDFFWYFHDVAQMMVILNKLSGDKYSSNKWSWKVDKETKAYSEIVQYVAPMSEMINTSDASEYNLFAGILYLCASLDYIGLDQIEYYRSIIHSHNSAGMRIAIGALAEHIASHFTASGERAPLLVAHL